MLIRLDKFSVSTAIVFDVAAGHHPVQNGISISCNFALPVRSFKLRCVFEKKLFHPNIYPSGAVCLSIINEDEDWRSALKVKDILLGIQKLLGAPNEKSPAQREAYECYVKDRQAYISKVKAQAAECKGKK